MATPSNSDYDSDGTPLTSDNYESVSDSDCKISKSKTSQFTNRQSDEKDRPLITRKRKLNQTDVIKKVFDAVKHHKKNDGTFLCEGFKRCPNAKQEPSYRDFVSDPMNITIIQKKIKDDQYADIENLQKDFDKFYKEDSETAQNAKALLEFFEMKKHELYSSIVKKQKCAESNLQPSDGSIEVPDVLGAVKELLKSLFTAVRYHKTQDGRCFFESFAELRKLDEVGDKKAISLDMIDRRLENGDYKRLDVFQDDLFELFESARRISNSHSQLFQDSVDAQSFFIYQRDKICKNGAILDSPALNYTQCDLDDIVSMIQERENAENNSITDEAENGISANGDRSHVNSFKVHATQKLNIIARSNPNADRSCIYYEQFKAPKCVIKIGDFVFVNVDAESSSRSIICCIRRIWVDKKGNSYFHGQMVKFPEDMPELSSQLFDEREVILTTLKSNFKLSQIVERCAVLKTSDYISCRPTEIIENNVFVCKLMYEKDVKQLISLPKYGIRKFVHCSAVCQDEVYFFSRVSKLEITNDRKLPREKHEDTFTWSDLNDIKDNTIPREDSETYIRKLLYVLFMGTKDAETQIRQIKNDLIKFSASHLLRVPKKPVVDIFHMLTRSKHVRVAEEKVNRLAEDEWYSHAPSMDYPYRVPQYIIKLTPGKRCSGQRLIFNTETFYVENVAEKIWRDPPREPQGAEIIETSDSDDSLAFTLNKQLFYKLSHVGSSWQAAFLGNHPFLAEHGTPESSIAADFSQPTFKPPSSVKSRTSSELSGESTINDDAIGRKACNLAKITIIPPLTLNQVKIEGDSLVVDVLIICLDMQLCRFLSATFGLIHVDEILLDFMNQKTERTKPSIRHRFTDEIIGGNLRVWWNRLMTINRGDYKTFRTLQTRYCEYLAMGCHNIAISYYQEILPNVNANSIALIRGENHDILDESLYTCILNYSPDLRFLSGASALARIVDCVLKYKTSVPMKFLYNKKCYEISVSLISVVPFYVLRAISAAKFEESIAKKMCELLVEEKDKTLV